MTGSVAVLQTGLQTYQMWYTAGERYAILDWISPGFKRGIVHIGHAISRDGIEWVKTKKPVLSPRLDAVKAYEAVVSKPAVNRINGTYHMWLSVFTMENGGGYRLNYARSSDGLAWKRFATKKSCLSCPVALIHITSRTQMSLSKATKSGCFMSATHSARRGSAWRR